MDKLEKNMQWHMKRIPDQVYRHITIGVKLEPTVELYLRQLAAGHTMDSMKQFMAKALIQCLNCITTMPVYNAIDGVMGASMLDKIEELAKEVDLDFTDCKNSETSEQTKAQGALPNDVKVGSIAEEPETQTATGDEICTQSM